MEPDEFDHPLPPRYVKGDSDHGSVIVLLLILEALIIFFLLK